MSRAWIYQRMRNDVTLSAMAPGGIYPSTRLERAPHINPFILYRQTSEVPFLRGSDRDHCTRLGYMVFCHDVPGDYMQIDRMIDRLRQLFSSVVDQPNNIVRCEISDISDDFRDEDMGTIMKYARLQVTQRLETT